MSCRLGGTSCRFPNRFLSSEVLSVWGGEEKNILCGELRFWIESDAFRVSWCFRYL